MSAFQIPSTQIMDGSIVVGPTDDITYYGALTIGGTATLTVEGTLTVSDNQDDVETLIDGGDTLTLFNGPEPVGPPRFEYPFRMNGDRASALFAQDYWQRTDKWVPAKLSTPFTPASDFYLIAETDPVSIPGGIYQFTRLFARVPFVQTDYSSLVLTKPPFPEEDYLGAWISSTSITETAEVWTPVITIGSVTYQPTGATFTVRIGGGGGPTDTAAIDWNDSDADVATAINNELISRGLTLRVSAVNSLPTLGRLLLTRTASATDLNILTWGDNSLTPSCVVESVSAVSTSTFYAARTSVSITKVAHGLEAGDDIRYLDITTGGGTEVEVESVTSDDVFTVVNSEAPPPMDVAYYRTLMRTYTPGPDRVISQNITSFYLPGVTPGITTPQDIPVPDVAINEVELLELIVNLATGFQTYDADPIERWPDANSPIYSQRLIKINVDNL